MSSGEFRKILRKIYHEELNQTEAGLQKANILQSKEIIKQKTNFLFALANNYMPCLALYCTSYPQTTAPGYFVCR